VVEPTHLNTYLSDLRLDHFPKDRGKNKNIFIYIYICNLKPPPPRLRTSQVVPFSPGFLLTTPSIRPGGGPPGGGP